MKKDKKFKPKMGNLVETLYGPPPKKKKSEPKKIESVDDIKVPASDINDESKIKSAHKIKRNMSE